MLVVGPQKGVVLLVYVVIGYQVLWLLGEFSAWRLNGGNVCSLQLILLLALSLLLLLFVILFGRRFLLSHLPLLFCIFFPLDVDILVITLVLTEDFDPVFCVAGYVVSRTCPNTIADLVYLKYAVFFYENVA